ncbi:LuxR C-terminal-related transcriptional regulator [Micromonospora halotolerans]|uniref:LuxR C-terminal-related transcriptional regulator n=1 Tax=Micromonospora halotolerans TaxID=709879 RepID=A0ABY9ZUP8_9ACTN|nr:LuxR C-terminal-related transcriptional regulator [Micromonospora halotolerans]WNM38707.1 LuxR C-terminal-related transcriptional regulator [Micromonospora halotolerans]
MGALRDLGMSDLTERAYLALVQGGPPHREKLAARLGIDVTAVDSALGELAGLGLVEPHGDRWVPLPPRLTLEVLAEQHLRAAAAARQGSEALGRLWAEQSPLPDYLEVLTTTDSTIAAQTKLHREVRTQVMALSVGPVGNDAPQLAQAPGSAEAMHRGVTYRVVYSTHILRQPTAMALVQQAISAGESARVFPNVPCNLTIADSRWAVLTAPMPGTERLHGLVILGGGFLDAVIGVFESFWALAAPISAIPLDGAPDGGPSESNRHLLTLLGAGLTDETIARELGVSERTVTRRIAALQKSLGARSRFQLGVQAARRGWL